MITLAIAVRGGGAMIPGHGGAEMAVTCTPRCMHAAGPATECRCGLCGGLAHGTRPLGPDLQLSLFEAVVAAPAGAAGNPHEATPASPGEKTTSTRPDGYYPIRPENGVTAGETAQLDNMGAVAQRQSNRVHAVQQTENVGSSPASALPSVPPANPDPQGAPAPDAAGGDRTTTETEAPTTNASQTDAGGAPGSAARPAIRRCSCGRLAAPWSTRCERCHPLPSLRALKGFGV